MKTKIFSTCCLLFLGMSLFAAKQKPISIENNQVKAVFLPDVGGRMVYFAPIGGENFLYSDSTLWNEPETERIKPSADAKFKPYNGFITWVGPQSEWWTHQNLMPHKKERADVWPPDPYLIYSTCEIIEKTDTSISLEIKCSPISGISLIKKFTLNDNKLIIEVTGKNCRETSISWDLWSNARFDAFTPFKVPANDESIQKIQTEENKFKEITRHKIEGGYFTFIPELPNDKNKQRISKAFIYPLRGELLVEKKNHQLKIEFEKVPKENIHPEQALVEVYNCVSARGINNILELEHHSAYQTLKPNEEIKLVETWSIIPIETN